MKQSNNDGLVDVSESGEKNHRGANDSFENK